MQNNNILYEISRMPIGELAEKPAAELAAIQKQIEALIVQADNIRKWLNGALQLKYGSRLDARRRELKRPYGEICLNEDGLQIVEDRPMLLVWQEEKLREYAARIAANGGNPEDYMDINFTISEKKYASLSSEVRKSLNAAGNIRPGKAIINLCLSGEKA